MSERTSVPLLVLVALACAIAVPGAVLAQEPTGCEVELEATFAGEDDCGDGTKLQFDVDLELAGEVSCARVEYDLILEMRQPNDQVTRVRKTQFTRLRDVELTQRVEHVALEGYALLDHAVRLVACTPCEELGPEDDPGD